MTEAEERQYKLDLLIARLNDVCYKVAVYLPQWLKRADQADQREQTHVKMRVGEVYDALDVCSFLQNNRDRIEELLIKDGATNSRFENDRPMEGDIVLFRHRIHPTLGDEEEIIGRVQRDAKGLHAGNRYLPPTGVRIIQKRRD